MRQRQYHRIRAAITANSLTVRLGQTNGARNSARCFRRITHDTIEPKYGKQSRVSTLQVAKNRSPDGEARKGCVDRIWLQGLLLHLENYGTRSEHQPRLVSRTVSPAARGNREVCRRADHTGAARESLKVRLA